MLCISKLVTKISEAVKNFFAKFRKKEDRKDRYDDIVCYYGCPNSDKVKKLQLEKRIF